MMHSIHAFLCTLFLTAIFLFFPAIGRPPNRPKAVARMRKVGIPGGGAAAVTRTGINDDLMPIITNRFPGGVDPPSSTSAGNVPGATPAPLQGGPARIPGQGAAAPPPPPRVTTVDTNCQHPEYMGRRCNNNFQVTIGNNKPTGKPGIR